jgi:hypothetical protein
VQKSEKILSDSNPFFTVQAMRSGEVFFLRAGTVSRAWMSVALFPPTQLKLENLANACCKGMVTLTIKIFFIKSS